MKRVVLALVAAALTLLAAEGVLRIAFDRSLFVASEIPDRPQAPPPPDPDKPGLYVAHPDPLVGYVLRPDGDAAIFDGIIHSDALGLRRRPGPPIEGDPLRICVLGDSVAFGFGLDDDETLAHHLEQALAAARPSGARPVVCRTVATPGWNHRNAVNFLLDHMPVLDPDIVLYMPIANDLYDTDGVGPDGHRRAALDPASLEPLLAVDQLAGSRFTHDARDQLQDEGRQDIGSWMGPPVLLADLSPASSERFDQNADSIERLADALDARGARLALLQYQEEIYAWNLRRRLIERGREVPVIPLFTKAPTELTLGFDPHPSAEGAALMARWIAGALLASGWVPGGAASTAQVLATERQELRAELLTPENLVLRADVARVGQWRFLQDAIDWRSLQGAGQIFGGVNVDGSAGRRVLVLLDRGGDTLEVQLAPVPERDDLLPLEVTVEIDGQRVGTVTLAGPDPATGRFAVPPSPGPHAEPIEVRLIPDRWAEDPLPRGTQSISFRPLRVSCPPD